MHRATVEGSYFEMGTQIGEIFSGEIRRFVQWRKELMRREFRCLGSEFDFRLFKKIASRIASSLSINSTNEYQELAGVSSVTGITLNDLILGLGYSDIFDVVAIKSGTNLTADTDRLDSHECSSFMLRRDIAGKNHYLIGQTWDMTVDTSEFVALIEKRPKGGLPFYAFSFVAGLAYIGVNSRKVCMGTTKVSSKDIGSGVFFPAQVQAILANCECLDQAVNILATSPKVSGHYYFLATPNEAMAVEVSASRCVSWKLDEVIIHTNHFLCPAFKSGEIPYSRSSRAREKSLRTYMLGARDSFGPLDFQMMLKDHQNGLCRHVDASEQLATVSGGAVFFEPSKGDFWFSAGFPCQGEWINVHFT